MPLIALLLAMAQASTTASPPPAPQQVDCNDANHTAFDFWIGEWDVSATGSAKVIARSHIEKIVGCAISETFVQTIGPQGRPLDYRGRSISSFVPADGKWRQFYVDSGGTVATLDGGIVDGAMVFETRRGGGINRMTLKANADGSVRQFGERSADGTTWTAGYDFTYRRR